MSDTPDLGKIVSLIMENPDIIARIQDLAKGNEEKTEAAPSKPNDAAVKEEKTAATVSIPQIGNGKDKRRALLSAMKPYLSAERSRAIDSMMSVAEMLDLMKSR